MAVERMLTEAEPVAELVPAACCTRLIEYVFGIRTHRPHCSGPPNTRTRKMMMVRKNFAGVMC